LVEALPWIRRFRGRVMVIKYGGNALAGAATDGPGTLTAGSAEGGEKEALASFAEDIVLLASVGVRAVVVHGGGPQIGELMNRLGKVPEFVDGLRVTDGETLDIVRMVLSGQVNREIVAALNVHGPLAVGVSGEDAALITASARDPRLGFVGDVASIRPELLTRLLAEDLVPVVTTLGTDEAGQVYNINADTVAGAIAAALGADKLVYLTDVAGIQLDRHDPATRVSRTTVEHLDALVADGTIEGGMIPKVISCTTAVRAGVAQAHILDGRVPHALLLEVFTDQGIGTMVTAAPIDDSLPDPLSTEADQHHQEDR
ncbi:MAG: acetylglutamate kinase, partial [Acidimicrobiaceae bacterium]|nr:acetylglutamate kinase [Acidimicrobiaceae bacterium]